MFNLYSAIEKLLNILSTLVSITNVLPGYFNIKSIIEPETHKKRITYLLVYILHVGYHDPERWRVTTRHTKQFGHTAGVTSNFSPLSDRPVVRIMAVRILKPSSPTTCNTPFRSQLRLNNV